jgi:hypothetical protein
MFYNLVRTFYCTNVHIYWYYYSLKVCSYPKILANISFVTIIILVYQIFLKSLIIYTSNLLKSVKLF